MSPRAALPAVLLALGCAGGPTAPPPTPFGGGVPLAGGSLVDGAALDLRAFAAELAFTMPEESREVLRALQRTEMARLEADQQTAVAQTHELVGGVLSRGGQGGGKEEAEDHGVEATRRSIGTVWTRTMGRRARTRSGLRL